MRTAYFGKLGSAQLMIKDGINMRYDVILWDLDGTLLDFHYAQHYAIKKCLEEINITATEEIIERYSQINDKWWKDLEREKVSKEQLLTGRFIELFSEYNIICNDVEGFRNCYEEYLGDVYLYIDDSLEICKSLVGKCRQFIVTNGLASSAVKKIKLSGFHDIMEKIFISEQLGAPKPQKLFFDKVFESMPEVPKDRILIVGDSLSSDILGGNRAGIASCWYNPLEEINATEAETNFTIKNLNEIFNIIEV